jgi:hypothetical protein
MKRLHQGLDYTLYKIYVWGGLPVIVIQILVSVLVFDAMELPTPQPFLVIMGPTLLWLAGIFLYWWGVFIFKGRHEWEEWKETPSQGVPLIKALKSWNTLHQAMSINGGDVEALIESEKKARRPMYVWFGSVTLIALWILCPIALGAMGIVPASWLGKMLIGIYVWVALMIVGTPFLLGWGARSSGKAYLAPLGLTATETPGLRPDVIDLLGGGQSLIPDGPAIVEGERHGRLVHVETIDDGHCLTVVQAALPEFRAHSEEGKLIPDEGAPEAALRALKSLRKAKRWQGIAVYAGPDGLAIQRQSKGTNMWLYDLWLAEYLMDRVDAEGQASPGTPG